MAGYAAPRRSPQRRIEHIKEMAGEIGTQQREVMHLLTLTVQALYLTFAAACITAGVVAEVQGRRSTAVVWLAIGIALFGIWLFVKVLAKSMKKVVRALKAEMAKLPAEFQEGLDRGPGAGVRDAAAAGLRGPTALGLRDRHNRRAGHRHAH